MQKSIKGMTIIFMSLILLTFKLNASDSLKLEFRNKTAATIALENIRMISFTGLTSIEDLSKDAAIENYPNPFSESTTIEFELKSEEHVIVNIFDETGEKVKTIECRDCKVGTNTYFWDCRDNDGKRVSSGIYYFEVSGISERLIQKLILVR